MIKPKQQLYKTAYSELFECYVVIDSAYQTDDGRWIYTCHNRDEGLKNHLFTEDELTRFCL